MATGELTRESRHASETRQTGRSGLVFSYEYFAEKQRAEAQGAGRRKLITCRPGANINNCSLEPMPSAAKIARAPSGRMSVGRARDKDFSLASIVIQGAPYVVLRTDCCIVSTRDRLLVKASSMFQSDPPDRQKPDTPAADSGLADYDAAKRSTEETCRVPYGAFSGQGRTKSCRLSLPTEYYPYGSE
jgi:hypothetical protein